MKASCGTSTLPTAFMTMPAGSLIGFAFFVMVFFAALTSAVALLEAPTSWAIDRFGMGRGRTTMISGGLVLLVGIILGIWLPRIRWQRRSRYDRF